MLCSQHCSKDAQDRPMGWTSRDMLDVHSPEVGHLPFNSVFGTGRLNGSHKHTANRMWNGLVQPQASWMSEWQLVACSPDRLDVICFKGLVRSSIRSCGHSWHSCRYSMPTISWYTIAYHYSIVGNVEFYANYAFGIVVCKACTSIQTNDCRSLLA